MQGIYRGEQGAVRFATQGAQVMGTAEGGGPCGWSRGDSLFEGHLEGNVLVGRLKVCQTGAGCGPKTYPLMAILDPHEGTLSGYLKTEAACQPTGLRDRLIVWRTSEEPAERGASATQVAARRLSKQDAENAERAFLQARKFLDIGQYKKAAELYERGLLFHDSNHAAYNQLGVARMKSGNPTGALDAYERSVKFAGKPDPVVHFNMACAWARLEDRERAMEQLRLAVQHGFPSASLMRKDKDLAALLKDDDEFKQLLASLERAGKRSN